MQGWNDDATDIENIDKSADNALREKRPVPSGRAQNKRVRRCSACQASRHRNAPNA
jgi:hypothetical protein